MRRLIYAPMARADLRAITVYIARDDPGRAMSFVEELKDRAQQALERPLSFRARDDIAPGLRSIVHRRYLILFREVPNAVRVERVVHGARDLRNLPITQP